MIWTTSEAKLRMYLLNLTHLDGGSKARFFLARGFTVAEWRVLDAALTRHPADNPVEHEEQTEFGRKLTVRCKLKTPDGSDPCIRTVWMVEADTPARLVTAYPSGR